MSLGNRIKLVRTHFNLNSSELAKIANVSSQTISNIENGDVENPRYQVILKISKKLGINLAWLMANEGKMLPTNAEKELKNQEQALKNKINLLERENFALKTMNEVKEEKIKVLEEQIFKLQKL